MGKKGGISNVGKSIKKTTKKTASSTAKGTTSIANTTAKGTTSAANTTAKGTTSAANVFDTTIQNVENSIKKKFTSVEKSVENTFTTFGQDIVKESEKDFNIVENELEKIYKKLDNVGKLVFENVWKFLHKTFEEFIDTIMIMTGSSLSCMCLPFMLLMIIISSLLKVLENVSDDGPSQSPGSDSPSLTKQQYNPNSDMSFNTATATPQPKYKQFSDTTPLSYNSPKG